MNTQTFLAELKTSNPNTSLVFQYSGNTVSPGYHVTEIMNTVYESVDCGGQADAWRETVVQLQAPRVDDEAAFMTVGKFLDIYSRVTQSLKIFGESELRLEYGDATMPALRYHVTDLNITADAATVSLTPPGVTCKALGRAQMISVESDFTTPLEVVAVGQKACC